ncbi:hypothetical protein IV203_035757 [Nitzschia inconspicua]|uniref:Uncharacterized protein n=1 Tax=Nitzschia inconspicua TaxID=303405 RepID=A0A9K3PV38_9STRA|nr:hypothetical protein IV203_035757 [Nitzschia inconspicua]
MEKSPVLILHWSDRLGRDNKLKEKLIPLVEQQIRNESKLLILPNPSPDCLWLTTTQQALEEEAENNFLIKSRGIPPSSDSKETETITDQFTVAERSQYLPRTYNNLVDVSASSEFVHYQ